MEGGEQWDKFCPTMDEGKASVEEDIVVREEAATRVKEESEDIQGEEVSYEKDELLRLRWEL